MTDTMRSVMCYGEHAGEFLAGGETGPGESFDAENITIQRTRTINPKGAAYRLGHPSFRGHLRNVKCNHNYMETGLTAIEANFNLDGYEVIGNVIKSAGQAIHCWRMSSNGLIADNLRIHDNTGLPVVVANAPGGWKPPVKLIQRNNRNLLSDPVKEPTSPLEPKKTSLQDSTDCYPTILEAVGLPPTSNHPLDGKSLLPLLVQSSGWARDTLYFHYPNYAFHKQNRLGSALREGDYKLIKNYDDDSLELYDLRQDLGEKDNLAAKSPELANRLAGKLDAWLRESDARLPVKATEK